MTGVDSTHAGDPALPVVVQLGFAGSRRLAPEGATPEEARAWESGVERLLEARLRALHEELGLAPAHFFCGVAQVAIGADTLFARVCRSLDIPLRAFLPQPRDSYLAAVGSQGRDFTDDEAAEASAHLDHAIQEHVAGTSANRRERFLEVNLEIVRVSDVVVCLLGVDAGSKAGAGGTLELIALAAHRGVPVLELRVGRNAAGNPTLTDDWHDREGFRRPALPEQLKLASNPGLQATRDVTKYCDALKGLSSGQAKGRKRFFTNAAWVIIGTHVVATLLAVLALKLGAVAATPGILIVEMVLLFSGLVCHELLHRSHAAHMWALARVVSEVTASVRAIRMLHVYLSHLFALPFPDVLRPLLRTLNVLHLHSACAGSTPWTEIRDRYVHERLTKGSRPEESRPQIKYYTDKLSKFRFRHAVARYGFLGCSVLALAATLLKLLLTEEALADGSVLRQFAPWLGVFAVVLPVIAVAALSLAASFDIEALIHTYGEMVGDPSGPGEEGVLQRQERLLRAATSEQEFARLVLATEATLLAEIATWASRRSFKGVT